MSSWFTLTFKDIAFSVSNLSDVTEILPFFFWLRSKSRSEPFLVLALYFLCSGTISLYGLLTAEAGIQNLHLYHIWAILQTIFLWLFYRSLWSESPGFWPVVLLFVTYFSASVALQNVHTMNSICWTVNALMIIYLGTKHFYRLYHDNSIVSPLGKRPDFVITAGWLVYAAGSLFAYLMSPDILRGKPEGFFQNAWIFQSVSNLIKTGAACYGFWLLKKIND